LIAAIPLRKEGLVDRVGDVDPLDAHAGLPAFGSAAQAAASAAALRSASASTMSASFPPHSAMTGVRFSAAMATAILACWPHAHTEVLSRSLDPH
jgi:hypothetical protein